MSIHLNRYGTEFTMHQEICSSSVETHLFLLPRGRLTFAHIIQQTWRGFSIVDNLFVFCRLGSIFRSTLKHLLGAYELGRIAKITVLKVNLTYMNIG